MFRFNKTGIRNSGLRINWSVFVAMISIAGCSNNPTFRTDANQDSENKFASAASVTSGNQASSNDTSNAPASESSEITGIELVEIQATCLSADCKAASFAATIKTAKVLVPLNEASAASFSLKDPVWDFLGKPALSNCNSTDRFSYAPKCWGDVSLNDVRATLTFVDKSGNKITGTQNVQPASSTLGNSSVQGNFALLDSVPNLKPTGIKYGKSSASFSQVWQDLVSGLYITNILMDNLSGNADWYDAVSICAAIDSGDGAGKWHLPTTEQFCGKRIIQGNCEAGLRGDKITDVQFSDQNWPLDKAFWTSTSDDNISADMVYLDTRLFTTSTKATKMFGTICIR